MRKSPFFLSLILLTSCGSEVPLSPEIKAYLDSCNLLETIRAVASLKTVFESQTTQDEKVEGGYSYVFEANFSDFSYLKKYEYVGSQIVKDEKIALYVTVKEVSFKRQKDSALYEETTTYKGYTDIEDNSSYKEITAEPILYQQSQIVSVQESFFYSEHQSSYYLGGLYYADLFKMRANQLYQAYSLTEENHFLYYVHDIPIDDASGRGIMNIDILMNDKGLLLEQNQSGTNDDLKRKTVIRQVAEYTYFEA